jgi:hypothetical protein
MPSPAETGVVVTRFERPLEQVLQIVVLFSYRDPSRADINIKVSG